MLDTQTKNLHTTEYVNKCLEKEDEWASYSSSILKLADSVSH